MLAEESLKAYRETEQQSPYDFRVSLRDGLRTIGPYELDSLSVEQLSWLASLARLALLWRTENDKLLKDKAEQDAKIHEG